MKQSDCGFGQSTVKNGHHRATPVGEQSERLNVQSVRLRFVQTPAAVGRKLGDVCAINCQHSLCVGFNVG